jgi:hypothetical protein
MKDRAWTLFYEVALKNPFVKRLIFREKLLVADFLEFVQLA